MTAAMMTKTPTAPASARKPAVPLWLKLVYTAFMAVLIPVYLYHYGPSNFLYFCDIALLLTLVGVWLDKPLLVSMPAVGILAPQIVWVLDFFTNMLGLPITGMTDYMFDEKYPLFLRSLSLFHGWLPFLLLYLVWRLGYDRRALIYWTVMAWGVLLICYFFLPGPMPDAGKTPVNINYVYGMSDKVAQTMMPPWAWLALMMSVLPVVLFAPVHWLLARWRTADGMAAAEREAEVRVA